MKKLLIIVLSLVFVSCKNETRNHLESKSNPYESVDLKSKKVPDSISSSKEIASFLTKSHHDTKDKVRALHIWITKNIKYDINKISSKTGDINKLIQETLDEKSGVCHHYSQLFHQMSQEIGVNSFYISGYTIDERTQKIADVSHAWNGVQIDSNFYFIDNTWAAGYTMENTYIQDFRDDFFLISPKEFIKTHMPFNDFFQFSNNPISYEDFEKRNFSKLDQKGIYSFVDSLIAFQSLDKLNRFKEENKRLQRDSNNNPLIREKIDYNTLIIDNIIYNQMSLKYSTAAAKMKKAFELNNQFIDFMNSGIIETEAVKIEMQSVIRKAVKNYRQGKAILHQLRKDKNKLSEQSKLKKLVDTFINSLDTNIQKLRKSLKLHALYADLIIR